MRFTFPLLTVLISLPCVAQRLFVYSPLTRVDRMGSVVKADRGSAQPRHILSPGIPRNAWSSFRLVVDMDKPSSYYLDIGQNPENAVKVKLYRENHIETANGWIPDTLKEVNVPYGGFATDFGAPGRKVVTFWLDIWVDRDAEVDRIKVEPQVWVEELKDWVVYPMEVRVQQPVVPDLKASAPVALPPPTEPADAAVWPIVCGSSAKAEPQRGQLTVRALLQRNARQHIALATNKEAMAAALAKATGSEDFCAAPKTPASGPEWYLRFRDAIFRAAGARN